jgi:hypothetical protein
MSTLAPPDFLCLLEAHLQPLHVPFSRAALINSRSAGGMGALRKKSAPPDRVLDR